MKLLRSVSFEIKETVGCQGGRGPGREGLGVGIRRCKLLYIEWINKVLLQSTGNCIPYPVINHDGKEYEKECIYVYN